MESGPAALSGFRLDKSFSIPLRSILIFGIVEHRGLYFQEYDFLKKNCVSSWYRIDLTLVGISVRKQTEIENLEDLPFLRFHYTTQSSTTSDPGYQWESKSSQ